MKKFSFLVLSFFLPVVVRAQGAWNSGLDDATDASGLPNAPIHLIIVTFMEWLLSVFSFIAIIGFAISGVWYLTSAGDEGRIDTAKRAMIYSIIGVLVGLLGLVILTAVDTFFTGGNRF
ncbi:MAG: hypothetical protein KC736_02205 [Candidatus Moranbacteria bacterium]|nr:hypothetical protein [Candidatus Moranbacteria bacterium]